MFGMKRIVYSAVLAVAVLGTAPQVIAQATGQGRAIVTVLSRHGEMAPNLTQQDVSAKVNGKDADVTTWEPFKGADDALELVILIDSGARNLGPQLEEIASFLQGQGPRAKVAVGYMQNGRAVLTGPLSTDRKQVAGELHLPAGPTSNPYFSLSDLAQHWPSQDRSARREVLLLSDGVDPEIQRLDPDDPYVHAAVNDSVRAGMVVFTLYWVNRTDRDSSSITANSGQSLLIELSQATGGYSYWTGTGNPVSFQPFFEDLNRRFASQYALEFSSRLDRKPDVEQLKLKVEGLGLTVTAPQSVYIDRNPSPVPSPAK
jgi:hypothetical protein